MKGYSHQYAAKQKHAEEISCTISERSFLQHPTVSICEHHVEEEAESYRTKEQEIREQSPYLKIIVNTADGNGCVISYKYIHF